LYSLLFAKNGVLLFFSMEGCVANNPHVFKVFAVACAVLAGMCFYAISGVGAHGNAVWDARKLLAACFSQAQNRVKFALLIFYMLLAHYFSQC
jgi:hypothetical protein